MADVKIFTDMIEDAAKAQIENIANHPAFADAKIRIMPDVHAGKGCVCGFTADLGDKVVPNLIGVDIGCGMLTVELGNIDIDYEKLDKVVHDVIPAGKNVHAKPVARYDFIWKDADPRNCFASDVLDKVDYFDKSIGTLGGGNHFVEVDVDSNGNKHLVIHTGSRNFGKTVCAWWQKKAVERMHDACQLSESELDAILNAG